MALAISTKRLFKFKKSKDVVIDLDDPNPSYSVDEVCDFYAGTYPEMLNAKMVDTEHGTETITFIIEAKYDEKG